MGPALVLSLALQGAALAPDPATSAPEIPAPPALPPERDGAVDSPGEPGEPVNPVSSASSLEAPASAPASAPAAEEQPVSPFEPQPEGAEAAPLTNPFEATDEELPTRGRRSGAGIWEGPPPTRSGEALMTAGIGFLVAGIPTTIVGLGLSFQVPIYLAIWVLPAAAFTGGGVGMTVGGLRMRRRYRQWIADNGYNPPVTGNGFITGGSILLGLSAVPLGIAIATGGRDSISLTSFIGAAAVGGVFLGVGIKRRRVYKAWRPGSEFARNMRILPTTLPGGGGVVFSTRF